MSPQVETAARTTAKPSDAEIQARLAKTVRLYAERATKSDGGFPAFAPDAPMTTTEVMITVTAILGGNAVKVFNLKLPAQKLARVA